MATFINQTKNSSTFSNQSKNSATFSTQNKSTSGQILATGGLYRGFGCFTYAGGEILVAGSLPIFTNQTKN